VVDLHRPPLVIYEIDVNLAANLGNPDMYLMLSAVELCLRFKLPDNVLDNLLS
jgi:hypothetical protein